MGVRFRFSPIRKFRFATGRRLLNGSSIRTNSRPGEEGLISGGIGGELWWET